MKKSVFILSLLLVATTSKSLSYKDVYHVATAEPYSSLKNGQRYYLIDEVNGDFLPIEDWTVYIKGENDVPELVGANPKLLANFRVYVNRRVIGWKCACTFTFSDLGSYSYYVVSHYDPYYKCCNGELSQGEPIFENEIPEADQY